MGLHVALLAGGRGTRSWPLSRRDRPKQLLDLTGEGPLLRLMLERVAALVPERDVLVVTSRDLERPAKLRQALRTAAAAARSLRALVLLGLEPERPEPGFGYLVLGETSRRGVRRVARFVEKPDEREAARLVARGALWNSGMFAL